MRAGLRLDPERDTLHWVMPRCHAGTDCFEGALCSGMRRGYPGIPFPYEPEDRE
jgi:hypothetical protein